MLTPVTQRLEVPGQPGQWVEIRKLGWRALRDASDAASHAAFALVRDLGKAGMEAVQLVSSDQVDAYKRSATAAYDPGVLLRKAIIGWSLSEKPTPDEIDDLSEEVAVWLVEQIVALAKPPRDEATVKNV